MGMLGKGMVTVVIPPFNEEEAIGLVLDELFEAGYKNVLTVDGTVKVAEFYCIYELSKYK